MTAEICHASWQVMAEKSRVNFPGALSISFRGTIGVKSFCLTTRIINSIWVSCRNENSCPALQPGSLVVGQGITKLKQERMPDGAVQQTITTWEEVLTRNKRGELLFIDDPHSHSIKNFPSQGWNEHSLNRSAALILRKRNITSIQVFSVFGFAGKCRTHNYIRGQLIRSSWDNALLKVQLHRDVFVTLSIPFIKSQVSEFPTEAAATYVIT